MLLNKKELAKKAIEKVCNILYIDKGIVLKRVRSDNYVFNKHKDEQLFTAEEMKEMYIKGYNEAVEAMKW